MKHRRSINLAPDDYSRMVFDRQASLETVPEWYALRAHCPKCEREGWIDRDQLQRRYGKLKLLEELRPKLRCRHCGNTIGNRFVMTKIAR